MKNGPLVIGGGLSPFLASAMARLSNTPMIVDAPKSMQDQKETPPVVLVDDTPKKPEIEIKPKSSCRHCYGRGYVGKDTATGKKIICRCVKRAFMKANNENKIKDAVLAPAEIKSNSGWDEPKAPVGNINTPAAQ